MPIIHLGIKDKIVEVRPRRARSRSKSREDGERSKSRAECSSRGSNSGFKTDLSSSKPVDGDAIKQKENNRSSPPILKSGKTERKHLESSPKMSKVDFSTSKIIVGNGSLKRDIFETSISLKDPIMFNGHDLIDKKKSNNDLLSYGLMRKENIANKDIEDIKSIVKLNSL